MANIKGSHIRRAKDDLEQLESNYLRQEGWEYSCRNPGSVWLWQRILPDGRTIVVGQQLAVSLATRLEDTRNNERLWVAGDECPECDARMEFDSGHPGDEDEPGTPACIYCSECGLEFQVDYDRQSATLQWP